MATAFLMGLDLGGSGARCLLVDPDSGEGVTGSAPCAPQPVPGVTMGFAYEPEAVWDALARAAREALTRAGARPEQVHAVAATSMRHGSVLLGADGRERFMTPNRDARGARQALELAESWGAELQRRTGQWPCPVHPAARLRWLAREAPRLLEGGVRHLGLSDWITWRLCGAAVAEPSQASETLLLGIEERRWDTEVLERLGLPRSLLPELLPAGSRAGGLGPAAARALGLRPGTPVAVGGGDTQCGLLAAGVTRPGELAAIVGTSAPVLQLEDHPRLEPEGRLWTVHHATPGRWALESNAGPVGEALAWVAGGLFGEDGHPVAQLLAAAAAAPRGAAGLLSNLGARVMDARRLELPLGHLALHHLGPAAAGSQRGCLARAILEGVACALRANAEQVEACSGRAARRLRALGGLARSAGFTQMLSDVLGRPVEVAATSEASALGAALCAGVAAGHFADLEQGADALARVRRSHEPTREGGAFYAEHRLAWETWRRDLAGSEATAAARGVRALATPTPPRPTPASRFRPRILATADLEPEGLAALRAIGDVEHASYRDRLRLLAGAELAAALDGVHVFLTEVDLLDAATLLRARDLQVVGVCRGDPVNVDVEACTALGVPVLHAPGRNAASVADLTLAFLLMLARRLPEASAFLREPGGVAGDLGRMGRAFTSLRGHELGGRSVGLVGLGAVGREVLRRLRAFGARCLVHDPYLDDEVVRLAGAEPLALEPLLRSSDFVSLHAASTEGSRGLIGATELACMRPGACLVNTARASLVDEDALLQALRSGRLAAAALDVFAVEPPGADHPLLALPNVVATPHVGGNTFEVAGRQGRMLAEDLQRLRRGEPPRRVVDRSALTRFRWGEPRPGAAPGVVARLGRGPAPSPGHRTSGPAPEPPAPGPAREEGA